MKTCSKCKESKPIEEFSEGRNQCKDCRNSYQRTRYGRKKDLILGHNKRWRENNREKLLASKKVYREENKEEVARIKRLWYEANKDHVIAKVKAWRKLNPEKTKIAEYKRRALKRGATATLTNEEWQEVWEEFDGKCFWCGDEATTMEHIVPLSPRPGELQGHHTKENVVPACGPCNSSKNNMDPLKFYFKRQEKMNSEGVEL